MIGSLAASTFVSAGALALTRGGSGDASHPGGGLQRPATTARPVAIERLIPADVVAFARVSVNPAASERSAIEALIRKVPASTRASTLALVDRTLESALPFRIDLRSARRVLGEHVAVTLVVVGGRTQIVTLLQVKDRVQVARTIRPTLRRGQTMTLDGNVAYVGSSRAITALRRSAKRRSMAIHRTYLRELGALGGSGLAVGWFDGSMLADVQTRHLPQSLRAAEGPTQSIAQLRRSKAVGVVFVAGANVVFEVRERGGLAPAFYGTSGPLRLLGRVPADAMFSLGMSDPATYVRAILAIAAPKGTASGLPPGVDLEKDVLSWLGDEVAFVVLGGNGGVGALIDIKDEAAFDRTFTLARGLLGRMDGASFDASGFTIRRGDRTFVVRRARGTVVLAMSEDAAGATRLARDLADGSGSPLSRDPGYRLAFGDSPASQRSFIRIDPKGLGRWGSLSGAMSVLGLARTISYEVRAEKGTSLTRVIFSLA